MYLGLDLGTSGVKALVIGNDQEVLAEARAPLSVQRPNPGWSEQDPASWKTAVDTVMVALAQSVQLSSVKGIGLSGHMHGATLIDANGTALRPCILWNDTRSHIEAGGLDSDTDFRKLTGNICFPGFTAPKLAWVKNNEPKTFAATAKVLLPKDYLRFWLSGELVSEMSDASGTGWLDVGARDWSQSLLAATDIGLDHMPRLVEGTQVSAGLSQSLARKWGMSAGTPIAGGGGDNAATAMGVGVTTPGTAFLSLGTSGVIFATTSSYVPAPETAVHTFCHALPDTWHQMGVILSCADALEWFGRMVSQSPADLTKPLQDVKAPGRALFMPYLGGERTPHNDATVRGAMIGLENETDLEGGTRAVLEGVGYALRDSLDALSATGTDPQRLIAVGGGAQSRVWLEMLATILNKPIDVPIAGDFGAAFGAARMGMIAVLKDPTIATAPRIDASIAPLETLTDAFAASHARYTATYSALRSLS